MGYESIVVIGSKSTCEFNGYRHISVIAIMDMSKCDSDFHNLFYQESDGRFFLPGEGNKEFTEDPYGDAPVEGNIEAVYNWLGAHIFEAKRNNEWVYRRYHMLFKMLEYFVQHKNEWTGEDLVILRYGH